MLISDVMCLLIHFSPHSKIFHSQTPNFPVCLGAMRIQHTGKSDALPETSHSSMLRLDIDCLHAETPLQKSASFFSEESKPRVSDPGMSCWYNYWPIIECVQQKVLVRRTGRSHVSPLWAIWKTTMKN